METGVLDRLWVLLQQFIWAPLLMAWNQIISYVPTILGALLILFVGSFIAKLVEEFIVRVVKILTIDKLADSIQLSDALSKGGIRRKLSELIGAIVYWIVILAFVMTALNALNLTVAAELFQKVVSFLPNVIAAVFILIVGVFASAFLAATVRTAAGNAGILQSHLLGQAVQTVMVIFTIVAALHQLQIQFVGEVFLIILAGISLGSAIAFGLGCKEMAGRWVNSLVDQIQTRRR